VSETVFIVFSTPPEEISAEAFGEWYERHIRDVVSVAGFRAARRFGLDAELGDASPTRYSHLVLYLIDGDPYAAMERLGAAIADGTVPMPDWFGRGRLTAFFGHPLEGPLDLDRLDHTYIVFSRPPAQVSLEDFFEWYGKRTHQHRAIEGVDQVWRYRLEIDRVDPLSPCESVHAAFYEVHGKLPQLRAALKQPADAEGAGSPEWFDEILFASLDAIAASPTVVGA
jgi:hypothetical protein